MNCSTQEIQLCWIRLECFSHCTFLFDKHLVHLNTQNFQYTAIVAFVEVENPF